MRNNKNLPVRGRSKKLRASARSFLRKFSYSARMSYKARYKKADSMLSDIFLQPYCFKEAVSREKPCTARA